MLQLHIYVFPSCITHISRAQSLTINRTLSAFGSSYLRSINFSYKLRGQSTSASRRLKLQDTSIIRNQYVPSASFSTVISSRSNVHIKSIFKDITSYFRTIGNMSSYKTEQRGSLYNDDYRLYIKESTGATVSPMHDIPLK